MRPSCGIDLATVPIKIPIEVVEKSIKNAPNKNSPSEPAIGTSNTLLMINSSERAAATTKQSEDTSESSNSASCG